MRVTRDGALLFTAHAAETGPLRERAVAWRESLEASGYTPLPASRSVPGGRPSELRSALRGVIDSAALLQMHDGATARELRDHATAALASLALRDVETLTTSVVAARATLSRMAAATSGANDLIASCHALIDRIEAAPEYAVAAPEPRQAD